jgi:hypothetical protein
MWWANLTSWKREKRLHEYDKAEWFDANSLEQELSVFW